MPLPFISTRSTDDKTWFQRVAETINALVALYNLIKNASAITAAGNITINIPDSGTFALKLPAGTTATAPLNIPHGSAPTTPQDGDIWTTTAGIYVRINGVTVGPLT